MLEALNDDILSYIFSLISPNSKNFIINNRLYQLRKRYLIEIFVRKHRNIILSPDKDYTILCLLYYYQCNLYNDINNYRLHILNFIANKKKITIKYTCKNSYHRYLIHNFCDSQGLLHETIEEGLEKVNICKYCHSESVTTINYGNKNKYYWFCPSCNRNAGSISHYTIEGPHYQKMILITKKKNES